MPVLSDRRLEALARSGMVEPFNPHHLSSCSIDLTLGDHVLIESLDQNRDGWVEVDITSPYQLRPKQFVLATTEEVVTIPPDCCAQVILRSSAARAGFDHCLAGFIDAGFSGQITLELSNKRQLSNIEVHSGQRLVQLVVHNLNEPPLSLYAARGNYQHQRRVTRSNNNLSAIS